MYKPLAATDQPCPRRRATAILGLVVLALLQVSVAAHQFEHSADHGFTVCHSCTVFSQLDHLAGAGATPFTVEFAPLGTPSNDAALPGFRPASSAYQPRAPPSS